MDLGIRGKRALVTCGSSGLGLAAVESLAAEGVDQVIFARGVEGLQRAKESVEATSGVKVDVIAGDLTVMADVRSLARYLAESGGLDILILNTPRPPSPMRGLLDENEDERWEEAGRTQLYGALNVLREITPLIAGRGWGRVIGVTSASVKQPMARHALSSVFRAGVQAALKHLVAEVGEQGVTVNSIAPATIVTPTFAQYHNLQRRIDALPLKRAGTLAEFGGTVAFLASQQAGFITGQIMQLDGGMTTSLV
jgi:3-oxoacyl-[acyl-carrier protein] reductase